MRNDEHWLRLTDSFYSAAIGGSSERQSWHAALEGLAEATGSSVGELICVGPNAAVPVNIMTNVEPGFHDAFVAAGGGDPTVNPRIGAGMKAPVLKSLAESDFITPDEYRRNVHYQEFAIPWGIPFICASTLERSQDLMIGLAVARTQAQGHVSDAERAVFESIAPHARAAVRMQIALEGQGATLLAGALEALSMPAFVCDRTGRVQALTPAAEQLVASDRGLQLRLGELHATHAADAKALKDAIDHAALARRAGGPPALQTVILRGDGLHEPSVVLDVITLPSREYELMFAPRVLIVARGERGADGRRTAILQTAFALTAAETDIALLLAKGRAPEVIAAIRGVSVATVRSQVKSIMAKVGVSRQVELVAKISAF